MADSTTSDITIEASAAEVMAVIADFEAYPQWTGAVKSAEVLSRFPDERAERVRYQLSAGVITDEYTLAYQWDGQTKVSWSLVEGQVLRAMDGSYTLTETGGRTHVRYELTVEVRIPMIGMIRRKAEKVIVDTALKELKKRVEG